MKTVNCATQPWHASEVAERQDCINLRLAQLRGAEGYELDAALADQARWGARWPGFQGAWPLCLLFILGIALGSAGCKPATVSPAKGTAKKPAIATPGQTNAPSARTNQVLPVFTDDPKTTHDPFFPNSSRRGSPAVTSTNTAARPVVASRPSVLTLKGIMGPASRRVALINDQELAEGDEAVFMLGGGEVRVRCIKIQSDAVEVAVGETGERKVLPLN